MLSVLNGKRHTLAKFKAAFRFTTRFVSQNVNTKILFKAKRNFLGGLCISINMCFICEYNEIGLTARTEKFCFKF